MTALQKKSPRLRDAGVIGGPLRSSQLIMTLDLVLDIGNSTVNEVRTEPKWLSPRGLRKGCQCGQDLLEVPSHQIAQSPPIMTGGPDIVFLQPVSLHCPSVAPVQKLVVPLSRAD